MKEPMKNPISRLIQSISDRYHWSQVRRGLQSTIEKINSSTFSDSPEIRILIAKANFFYHSRNGDELLRAMDDLYVTVVDLKDLEILSFYVETLPYIRLQFQGFYERAVHFHSVRNNPKERHPSEIPVPFLDPSPTLEEFRNLRPRIESYVSQLKTYEGEL